MIPQVCQINIPTWYSTRRDYIIYSFWTQWLYHCWYLKFFIPITICNYVRGACLSSNFWTQWLSMCWSLKFTNCITFLHANIGSYLRYTFWIHRLSRCHPLSFAICCCFLYIQWFTLFSHYTLKSYNIRTIKGTIWGKISATLSLSGLLLSVDPCIIPTTLP